ncbi:hypothetical protein KC350_g48 [Hortaea werneckii]|nr:hypothetical protein KC350_g48 [Hortaea werneckii]
MTFQCNCLPLDSSSGTNEGVCKANTTAHPSGHLNAVKSSIIVLSGIAGFSRLRAARRVIRSFSPWFTPSEVAPKLCVEMWFRLLSLYCASAFGWSSSDAAAEAEDDEADSPLEGVICEDGADVRSRCRRFGSCHGLNRRYGQNVRGLLCGVHKGRSQVFFYCLGLDLRYRSLRFLLLGHSHRLIRVLNPQQFTPTTKSGFVILVLFVTIRFLACVNTIDPWSLQWHIRILERCTVRALQQKPPPQFDGLDSDLRAHVIPFLMLEPSVRRQIRMYQPLQAAECEYGDI